MKEQIILLTGTSRFDNLYYLAKHVNEVINKYKDKFDIYWLICKDSYNGKGDINKAVMYLFSTNIQWQMYESGLPNQSNWGGNLFNIPLQNFISEFNLGNPWVYVLDDDNIIHPRLLEVLEQCQQNDYYGNKEVLTTINKWDCGHNREIDDMLITYESNKYVGFKMEWFLFDPSQVLLRLSIIKKYGYFGTDYLYDFNWLNPLILQESQNNNVIFFTYYNHPGQHIVTSYHDGLIPLNKIKEFNNVNLEDTCFDILLQNNNITSPLNIPILKKETKETILKLIEKDYKEFYEHN